jgi:hypothetical protein
MRRAHFQLSALLLATGVLVTGPSTAAAQNIQVRSDQSTDSTARFSDRRAPARADFAIVSTDGLRALLLLPGAISMQLTDAGLERIGRAPADAPADQGPIARLIEGMARGGLRVLLDRALDYELRELSEVRIEGERLVFINREGKPVFDEVKIDGREFMEGFSPRDARAFADRVNRRLR